MGGTPRRADLAFVLFCLLVAALFGVEAARAPASPFDPLGPGSVPLGLSILLALLALLLLARLLLGLDTGAARQSLLLGLPDGSAGTSYRLRPDLAVLAAVSSLVYVAVLQAGWPGFVPATFVYLEVLGAAMLPRRRGPQAAALAIAALGALGLRWIFTRVLIIDLP
jgi:hypothetical protein